MGAQPPPRPALNERQRRVLWLLSVGYLREDIARETGWTLTAVANLCHRVYTTLGAATPAQAVRIGLLDGHIGPNENCGTLTAYRLHIKRDEPMDAACKRGNRERVEMEALRLHRPPLSEPQIRLLRLWSVGRSNLQICRRWGISESTIKRLTASTYTALGVDQLPQPVRRESALREARMRGVFGTQPPSPSAPSPKAASLSGTHVRVLASLESGATLAQTAERLNLRPGTCSTRLSEAYKRLEVDWMEKGTRLPAALRKARALGLMPEPATV